MIKIQPTLGIVISLLGLSIGVQQAQGTTIFTPSQTYPNPTPGENDEFGFAVALNDQFAVVGTRFDDIGGVNNIGSVDVFDVNSNQLLRTINNPTPDLNDQFGTAIAISDNVLVVGSPLDDTLINNTGIAYLFDLNTGDLLQTLNNPTPDDNDRFGASVAIEGTNVLVGAIFDDEGGVSNTGVAYLFNGMTGDLLQTFSNPTPDTADQFGSAVAISGDLVLISDRLDDAGGNNSGLAHLFDTSGTLLQTFASPTPAPNDQFGFSLALEEDQVLIGALGAFGAPGSANLFDAQSGNLIQTFNTPTPDIGNLFARSVAIQGDNVLVGDSQAFDAPGAIYRFDAISGELLEILQNPTGIIDEQFGISLAVNGDHILVGAINTTDEGTGTMDSGTAYLFKATKVPEPTTILSLIVMSTGFFVSKKSTSKNGIRGEEVNR